MGNTLKEKAVGSIVKLNVLGKATEFIVVHHGKPSDSYDESCSGTWLLMKDCYESRPLHSSHIANYANTNIHSYLNDTFLNLFDTNVQEAIKEVKIPYAYYNSGIKIVDGENGLPAKLFLLSAAEVNFTATTGSQEGSPLEYFKYCQTGNKEDSLRVGYLDGEAVYWWTRSTYGSDVSAVYHTGSIVAPKANASCGIRPALILDSENTYVLGDGTVLFEDLVVSTGDAVFDEIRDDFAVGYTVTVPKLFGTAAVTEYVNDTVIRTYSVASGMQQEATILVDRLADGANEVVIEVEAGGMTAKKIVPFCLLPIAGNDNGTVQELQDENGDPIFPVTQAKAVITESGESVERALMDLNTDPVLLWENASPTSEFAAQTVKIDSYKYDAVVVCANFSTEETGAAAELILRKGEKGKLSVAAETNRYRSVELNDEGVEFSDGSYFGTYGNSTAAKRNTDTIPLKIYGVKEVASK